MKSLHTILEADHSVSSKFTTLVLQDMIREHTNTVTDITSIFLKVSLKLAIPLIGSLAILSGLSLLDSTQVATQIMI